MYDHDEAMHQHPILPRLNEPAPAFEAETTDGPRSLESYKGRWLILFSHPADFTPVCTTEFLGFARHYDEFQAMGCDLLGLSIDSRFAHIAWLRNIEERIGVTIPFPVIADLSMEVARSYGMIHPGAGDTSTVRTTFVIDDKGILRAMLYYPMSNGRSIAEIVRLLQALQLTDEQQIATPEGWQPGNKVIVPPPATAAEAAARVASPGAGVECVDWYLCTKPLDSSKQGAA